MADFRPFSMAVAADRSSLYLVDWAYSGWLDAVARTGRLYRLRRDELGQAPLQSRPGAKDDAALIAALDHPALSVRLDSQRSLAHAAVGWFPCWSSG